MYKIFINPGKFINFYRIIFFPVLILTFILLFVGLVFVFFISPDDYQQGAMVKIMYIHVPSAWIALLTYLVMTIYSICGLSFKISFGYIVNAAIAPIGAVFTFICLFTGSLWGKPIWGTWWVWDARLTSVLILFILYLIIIFLKYSFHNKEVGDKITAVLIILGSINLPIIKFSVDWWNTLHQPASISLTEKSAIHPSMLVPLIIMTAAFALFSILIFLMKYNTELIKVKNKGLKRL